MNQKAEVKREPICRSGGSGSGLLPDSLSEPLSAFACAVEKLHQGRMEESSLNNVSLRAAPGGRKSSRPTTRYRCIHVLALIKDALFCYTLVWST